MRKHRPASQPFVKFVENKTLDNQIFFMVKKLNVNVKAQDNSVEAETKQLNIKDRH